SGRSRAPRDSARRGRDPDDERRAQGREGRGRGGGGPRGRAALPHPASAGHGRERVAGGTAGGHEPDLAPPAPLAAPNRPQGIPAPRLRGIAVPTDPSCCPPNPVALEQTVTSATNFASRSPSAAPRSRTQGGRRKRTVPEC